MGTAASNHKESIAVVAAAAGVTSKLSSINNTASSPPAKGVDGTPAHYQVELQKSAGVISVLGSVGINDRLSAGSANQLTTQRQKSVTAGDKSVLEVNKEPRTMSALSQVSSVVSSLYPMQCMFYLYNLYDVSIHF